MLPPSSKLLPAPQTPPAPARIKEERDKRHGKRPAEDVVVEELLSLKRRKLFRAVAEYAEIERALAEKHQEVENLWGEVEILRSINTNPGTKSNLDLLAVDGLAACGNDSG